MIKPRKENAHGCKPLSLADFPDSFQMDPMMIGMPRVRLMPHNTFVLLERGHCSNPTKVRNVESFGAILALIGDEKDEDVTQIIMEDYDGSGFALKIPAYMIEHRAFLKIKQALDDKKEVYLSAELIISRPDNSIEMGVFWGSSLDMAQYSLEAFSELVAQHMANNATETLLKPHVHTFACPTCPKAIKTENCLSNGQFCAFFPKLGDISQEDLDPEDYVVEAAKSGKYSTDFTGRDLLISSLFEKCAS